MLNIKKNATENTIGKFKFLIIVALTAMIVMTLSACSNSDSSYVNSKTTDIPITTPIQTEIPIQTPEPTLESTPKPTPTLESTPKPTPTLESTPKPTPTPIPEIKIELLDIKDLLGLTEGDLEKITQDLLLKSSDKDLSEKDIWNMSYNFLCIFSTFYNSYSITYEVPSNIRFSAVDAFYNVINCNNYKASWSGWELIPDADILRYIAMDCKNTSIYYCYDQLDYLSEEDALEIVDLVFHHNVDKTDEYEDNKLEFACKILESKYAQLRKKGEKYLLDFTKNDKNCFTTQMCEEIIPSIDDQFKELKAEMRSNIYSNRFYTWEKYVIFGNSLDDETRIEANEQLKELASELSTEEDKQKLYNEVLSSLWDSEVIKECCEIMEYNPSQNGNE